MSATPDDFDDLEAEREFLLKSLDDLDDELVAGNIDPDTYRTLHDDYTARASAVIQTIEAGEGRKPRNEARRSPAMKVVTVGGIVVFCVLGAFLLSRAIGPRAAGQTSTGNAQTAQNAHAQSAKDAVAANPRDYNARITYARQLRNTGDYLNAIVQYTAAVAIDPNQPEPLAYRAWLSILVATQLTDARERTLLAQRASADLNQAISLDASYPDAYAFKGVMLLKLENKPADAIPVLQKFLLLTPTDNALRPQVLTALQQAESQSKKP